MLSERSLESKLRRARRPELVDKFYQFLLKLGLIWIQIILLLYYAVIPLQMSGFIAIEYTLWSLVICIAFTALIWLCWMNLNNQFGVFSATLVYVAGWFVVNELLVKDDYFTMSPLLGGLGWILIVYISLEALVVLSYLLILSIRKFLTRQGIKSSIRATFLHIKKNGKPAMIAFGIIMLCGSYLLYTARPIPRGQILIQPQDYTARIAFWGSHYHTRYTPEQIDALNRHGVIIAPYTVSLDGSNATADAFIEEMRWWETNAPNVDFLPAVLGIPGLFVWDGAMGSPDLL
jgi:hypothetical protein